MLCWRLGDEPSYGVFNGFGVGNRQESVIGRFLRAFAVGRHRPLEHQVAAAVGVLNAAEVGETRRLEGADRYRLPPSGVEDHRALVRENVDRAFGFAPRPKGRRKHADADQAKWNQKDNRDSQFLPAAILIGRHMTKESDGPEYDESRPDDAEQKDPDKALYESPRRRLTDPDDPFVGAKFRGNKGAKFAGDVDAVSHALRCFSIRRKEWSPDYRWTIGDQYSGVERTRRIRLGEFRR